MGFDKIAGGKNEQNLQEKLICKSHKKIPVPE